MKKTILLLFVISLIIMFSCKKNTYSNDIENLLIKSGKNKKEIEYALNYYNNAEDTLKKKALHFLLKNMVNHYSSNKTTFLNKNNVKAFNVLNSQTKKQFNLDLNNKQNKSFWLKNRKIKNEIDSLKKSIKMKNEKSRINDLHNVKGDYLINYINNAFLSWKRTNLINKNDFYEFKNTLLPYRYLNEQINYTSKLKKKIWVELLTNTNLNNVKEVINILSRYFTRLDRLSVGTNYNKDLGFYNILQWNKLSCNQQTVIAAHILNDIGIPTYIDFTPMWLNRFSGHSWCVSKDSTGTYIPFSPWWQSVKEEETSLFRKNYFQRTSKVYRRTYEIQKQSPVNFVKENEKIPAFFNNKHLIDVTDKYHKTTVIKVLLKDFNFKKYNLAYLAIFKRGEWQPIAWSKVDPITKQVTFNKVPVGVMYVIGTFDNYKIKANTNVFLVNNKGILNYIEPKLNTNIEKMVLFEKYPEKERLQDYRAERIGGSFQASNDIKFKDLINLYTFKKRPEGFVKKIILDSKKSYRYVRFIPKNLKQSGIAICEYFKIANNTDSIDNGTNPYIFNIKSILNTKNKKVTKLKGKLISNNKKASFKRLNKASDGNLETYLTDKWVGYDFGKPEKIYSIRYAFRNANNKINVGDIYELYYYSKGWKYIDTKKANYNFLEFKNVPSNTIYWLKNISKGKEELPFLYINNKQVFVNHDTIKSKYIK